MLAATEQMRTADGAHGMPMGRLRIRLSSHDLTSNRTGKKTADGFLDVRGEFAPDRRGHARWKLRVALCGGEWRTVLDSAGFLSFVRCDCSYEESERTIVWRVDVRAWRRRMVLDLHLDRTADGDAPWSGRGEWKLYRGKRLLDEGICENVRCDREFDAETVRASEKKLAASAISEDEVPQDADAVDWSRREVLVGSLGSREQFFDNLKRNYYYVPAKYLDQTQLPIACVALYQSANLFGRDAGVRHYGEVTETRLLRRREIKFRGRWRRDDEMYYAFRIKEWRQLPTPIEVKDEGVYAPRLTNLFLLHRVTSSYALFHVRSAAQYRLLQALERIKSGANGEATEPTSICLQDGALTLTLQNGALDVLDRDGCSMLDAPIRLSELLRHPKYYFDLIVEKTRMDALLVK